VTTDEDSTSHWNRWAAAGTSEEERRLGLMERAYDDVTVRQLERIGVGPGRRCLEVGAGRGSIAAWLAGRAGAANVVATELHPELLDGVRELGVRALRHDVTSDPAPGDAFDLVHARFVLEHLPARDEVLRRLASWLTPGGWLLVESMTCDPSVSPSPAVARVEKALMALVRRPVGTDLDWARGMPLPLERAGLSEASAEVASPVMRGGGAVAGFLVATMEAARAGLIAADLAAEADLDEVGRLWADPSFVDCSFLMVASRARRPGPATLSTT
jgi:2-polyprenyl-3-methyl-5-hydroxy-6-metoxy-1,4-benzoquinol methylase